jgi:hypothetical protein
MAFSFMIFITLSDFTPFSKLNLFPASDIGSFRVYCNTCREEGVREGATVKGHEIQRESDNSFAGPATLLLTSQQNLELTQTLICDFWSSMADRIAEPFGQHQRTQLQTRIRQVTLHKTTARSRS